MGHVNNKHIVLTGAANGLGRSLTLKLLEQGSYVYALDFDSAALARLPSQTRLITYEADARDLSSMQRVAKSILDVASIDIVIACAGVGGINPAYDFSYDLDHKIMDINYFGTVNTLMPFVPGMLAKKSGHLVAVSSLAAMRGPPLGASYGASKVAQTHFMESLRLDVKSYGVKVSCIHPGFIATAMADHKEFVMPFTVSAEKAADRVLKAIRSQCSQSYFPCVMGWATRFSRFLPNCIYDILALQSVGKERKKPQLFSSSK